MRYLFGNWKMNLLPDESLNLAEKINLASLQLKKTIVGIAPTTLCLTELKKIPNRKIMIGAQNAHWENSGAFTGEVSAQMYKSAGADFAIIGHSERRHKFFESQEQISLRAAGVLNSGLKLVYCIGETESERTSGKTNCVLESQIKPILPLISKTNSSAIILAYEPVWAIGTGKVASIDDIKSTHSWIQTYIKSENSSTAIIPPILYGGSVTPDNYAEIAALPEVAGALVGGASLKAESFLKLLSISEEV